SRSIAEMESTGYLLLLALVAVQANASLFYWDENFQRSSGSKYGEWMTDEQKAEVAQLHGLDLKNRIMDFYRELDDDVRAEWDRYYRKHCVSWIKDVTTEEEIDELKEVETNGNREDLIEKIYSYKTRLTPEVQEKVGIWRDECQRLLRIPSRRRRDLDKNFEEFTSWMTEDQRKTISDLKDSGKSYDELRQKTIEFFEALPAERQETLKNEFKGKCKAFFKKIATAEEMDKMKELHDAGSDDEVRTIIKEVIGRQTGHDKALAVKMEALCADVFSKKTKARRDIDEKIDRRLPWMTTEQKQECYKWMDDVATEEEIAALHKMHETDHEGCKKKVREFIERLPEAKKEDVMKNLPFCEKIWYGEHQHHKHHGHHHRRRHVAVRRRRHLHAIDKFLHWLTPDQKSELEGMEQDGSHFDNVIAKVKEFFGLLPEEKKAELKASFKDQCSAWVKEVATPEEMAEIKKMHETKDHVTLKKKIMELEERLTEEQKHTVEHVRDVCYGVWELQQARRRRDHHEHNIEEGMQKFLTWLTDDQKKKVKATYESGDREAFYKEIMEMYEASSGEVKTKAGEELKAACKHYGKDLLGEDKLAIIKEMKDSGASHEAIAQKVEEIVEEISDPERKAKAKRFTIACKKIYGSVRTRRDHPHPITLEEALHKYLTWLSDDQKAELKSLKESGDKEGIYKKVMEYFEHTSGEKKEKAAEELQAACKHYIKEILGEEKAAKFRAMKESGTHVDEIAKKIEEAIEELTDDTVKTRAKKASAACKRIFGLHHRFRRDHHHEHKLEEALEKYLSWLSDDQKEKVRSIYAEGGRSAVYEKVMEYYDEATGDTKEEATKELKGACKHYIKDLIGEKNGEVIREMKESGASNDAIATKVEEMIEAIADDKKKSQALRASANCKKIYGVARRLKREHHEHKLEEALEKYLTWLNADQTEEVKKLYDSGDKQAMYKKVMEYFDTASGDVKEKATVELKAACRHYVTDSIGEEKAEKLKEMKESGASHEAIAAKVEEFIAAISDEKKKAQAERMAGACKKIYGVARRLKREHHEHNLEEAMEKYLTWLNDDQKEEVKKLYDSGDKHAMYKKVMEIYDSVSGDVKEKATVELKAACRHYIKDSIGEEKAEKIKEMKESGASHEAIAAKIEEFIAAITDEKKKAQAERASVACKKIYGVARRLKREHHEHKLEEAMEKYLTWLDADQKEEVKKLHDSGDKQAMYKKVMEYYDSASGDVKEKATAELKAACRHYVKDSIGEEKAEKLKEMKESGATPEAIAAKVEEFIAAITDEKKKAQAERMAGACKKIYGVARRLKREHHEHKLEEALEKYLTWLNADQKEEVKKLYESGDKQAMYKKVMEYFDTASGDVKEKATVELKAACRHYVTDSIGEENAGKLKEMKESGASHEAIAAKVDEFIAAITDEKKKAQAERASVACKKIYGVARRFRRDHHEHNIEEAMEKYLSWLRDDQKAEVRKIYGTGDRIAVEQKVLQMFENAKGDDKEKASVQLKAACKHYIKEYIGEQNVATIKQMKDSGATNEAMSAKIDEFIAAITEKEKREKAERVAAACKKVYNVKSRMRRDMTDDYDLDSFFENRLRAHRHLAAKRRRHAARVHFLDI
uniref:WW domain-containing protein n=1 Tax=Haemonchus contortus TaxID=6289 RepID=A0A7I4YXI6_HAECO